MSNKRIAVVVVLAVVIILAIILGTFVIGSKGDNAQIQVPDISSGADTQAGDDNSNSDDSLNRVQVSPDSVQNVIASITRPESYSREITVTTYSGNVSTETKMNVHVVPNALSVVERSDPEKHTVLAGNKLYIWYGDDNAVYTANVDAADNENSLSDRIQMMVTYEDVLALDKSDITDAGYVQQDGQLCIFVTYTSGELGYTSTCYISSKLGLVISAQIYDGQELVYEMSSGDIVTGEEDMSDFVLPNGTSVL